MELDEEREHKNSVEERNDSLNSLANSAQSATFPSVSEHLRMDRAASQELDTRRETFKPPHDPTGEKFGGRDQQFTFSKKEKDENRKSYMKSMENPFKTLIKPKDIVIEEKLATQGHQSSD